MSINPTSDLVLDVIRAGDPARADAVTQRLEALSGMTPAESASFSKTLEATQTAVKAVDSSWNNSMNAGGARTRLAKLASGNSAASVKEKKVAEQFEASILGSFMQEIMPKDNSSVYGQGFAGGMWRSLLANQIAQQIAASGALGIAKKLFATHGVLHESQNGADNRSASDKSSIDRVVSGNALSLPQKADVQDGAFLFNRKESI